MLNSCNLKSSKNDNNDYSENADESYYFEFKSQTINKIKYDFFIEKSGEFKIQESKDKIIYSQTENVTDFELVDFNKDGFIDVIINHPSNRVLQTLLLYKPGSKTFVLIDDFIEFPNSKKIKSTKFYYSYQGNGCAQNDWSSYLYKIENNKIIKIGLIDGEGCLENDKNGIYIYNIKSKESILIKYIKRGEGFWKDKWDLIDNYWNENYMVFSD